MMRAVPFHLSHVANSYSYDGSECASSNSSDRGTDLPRSDTRSEFIKLVGLPFHTPKQAIREFVSQFRMGPGKSIYRLLNKRGSDNGKAVIRMQSEEEAHAAAQMLHMQYIGGRYVEVYHIGYREAVLLGVVEHWPTLPCGFATPQAPFEYLMEEAHPYAMAAPRLEALNLMLEVAWSPPCRTASFRTVVPPPLQRVEHGKAAPVHATSDAATGPAPVVIAAVPSWETDSCGDDTEVGLYEPHTCVLFAGMGEFPTTPCLRSSRSLSA